MIRMWTEKLFLQSEGEKESSTSESSLESSSGYGSQTTFPVDDPQHMEGKRISVCLI